MEFGDLVGWVAALIALGAMCVAIWNASSAEKQAQAATRQAEEAEMSRKAAEVQADAAVTQAEEATRARHAAEEANEIAHQDLSESRKQAERMEALEAYRLLVSAAQCASEGARTLSEFAYHGMRSAPGIIDTDLQRSYEKAISAQRTLMDALMCYAPVRHRLPVAEEVSEILDTLGDGLAEIDGFDPQNPRDGFDRIANYAEVLREGSHSLFFLTAQWARDHEI